MSNIPYLSCSCFENCPKLKKLNNLSKTILFETSGVGPIYGCSSLEGELDLTNGGWRAGTSNATAMSGQYFRQTGWEVIKLPKTTRSITSAYVFYNATRLKSLVIPAEVLVTISHSNALGNLASGAKIYVPNDLVISYRKASYWSAIYTRILPIIDGPSVIHGDGTYSFVPNTPFSGFTDIEWTLEENDYLSLTTEQDGSATIVASGMTSDTDTTVQLGYSFVHNGNSFTGTINIPVAYQEIIQFEDKEVKRICVNNWGGIYGSAVKIPGVPGELTMEQAGSVTTIGTVKNTFPASPFHELYYFGLNNVINVFQHATFSRATLPKDWTTVLQGCFADCANLTHVSLPNITSIGNSAFTRSGKLISLKIDSITPPTIESNAFYNCGIYLHIAAPSRYPTPGYIYVPDSAVETYKSTGSTSSYNSWAFYRDFIKPLSEYTD